MLEHLTASLNPELHFLCESRVGRDFNGFSDAIVINSRPIPIPRNHANRERHCCRLECLSEIGQGGHIRFRADILNAKVGAVLLRMLNSKHVVEQILKCQ